MFSHLVQTDNHVEGITGLSHSETHNNPTTSSITFGDIKEAFLAQSLSVSQGRDQTTSTSKKFSNTNVIVLEATIDTTITQDYCCLLHLDS